jgi:hypothetical protein
MATNKDDDDRFTWHPDDVEVMSDEEAAQARKENEEWLAERDKK